MEKRLFGKTGIRVSPLGFGAAPIGYLKTDRERVASMLSFLLDAGLNVIDTASSYEGSEELIGETISERRDEYVLISKCGRAVNGITGEDWSAALITDTIDRSLKRLRTDRLDVMLLHSCELNVLEAGAAVAALAKARDAGKIRFAGYSGDNDAAAYAATLADIAVIETSISFADQANIVRVLPVASQHNVGVIAKRPIANAAWKSADKQPGMYASYAAPYTERLQKMQLSPDQVAMPSDAWAEMALRFTLSFPQVATAIIGTTNPDNAKQNIAAADKGPLPADAVQKIQAAFHHADPTGNWKGLT